MRAAAEVGRVMRIEQQEVERAILALLNPRRLYCRTEVLNQPSPVPRSPGVYAWYFDKIPPRVPADGCHKALGHTLLYVGIAPMKRIRPAHNVVVQRTLHHRLRDHFAGNAEGSTLIRAVGKLPPTPD